MRYAVIKTQKKQADGVRSGPTHWLKRGTLVRITGEGCDTVRVETLVPVFGVQIFEWEYSVRTQYVYPQDIKELPEASGPFLEAAARAFRRVRETFGVA